MASLNFSRYDRDEVSIRIAIGADIFDGAVVQKCKVIRGSNGTKNFRVGTSLSAFAQFSIFDEDEIFSQKEFSDSLAKIELGARDAEGGLEWATLGEFSLETPKKNADNSWSFEGYDLLQKARKAFDYSGLVYPLTIKTIVVEACRQSGIVLGTSTWENSDKIIDKPIQFYEASCKEVIEAAAELALAVAYINPHTQKLEIRPYKDEPNYIKDDLISHFKKEEEEPKKGFDHLIIMQTGTADYKVGEGEAPYYIEDNLFIQGDPERFATALKENLPGLTSNKGVKLTWKGDPTLSDIGIYNFNFQGVDYKIIPQVRTFEYDGGLKEVIECNTSTYAPDNSKERKQVRNIYKAHANLEVAKKEILATIGDEVGQKLTELRLDEEGIKQRVANTVNTYVTENAETLKGEDGKDAVYNLVCLSTSVKDTYLVSGAPESTVVKHNTSDFIEVKAGADYTFSKETSTITSDQDFRYAFYTTDKEFIAQSDSVADLFTLKAPEGAFFLRVSYPADSKPMIEQGAVDARTYAPHPRDVVAKSDFQAYQEVTNSSISQRVSVDTYNSNNQVIDKKIGDVKLYVNNALTNFEVSVDKIKLEGYTTINGGFSVDLQGNIIASSGRIGNFNISQVLRSNNDGRGRYLQLDGRGDYDFLSAGYIDAGGASKPWTRIDKDGKFYATAGEIGGWQINTNYLRHENASRVIQLDPRGGTPPIYVGTKSGSTLTPQFQVLDNGSVYVKNGGVIGNWEVTPDGRLIGGKSQGVTIQLDPRGLYSPIQYNVGSVNYFSVNKDGSVYSRAMNANGSFRGESYGYGNFSSGSYTGNVYSSSGTLGGVSFVESSEDGAKFSGGITGSFLSGNNVYFTTLRSLERNSSGYSYNANLRNGAWAISNSDIRLKENIRELGQEYTPWLYDMPIIMYTLKSDDKHTPRVGVNANLLMKTLPDYMARSFLHQDEKTGLYGANYELLVPFTIKAIQDLNNREIALKNKIEAFEKKLEELENAKHK